MKAEQENELEQPVPVVLHPFKYVSHSESDFAVVLSEQTIFLHTEFDQIHLLPSKVAAIPQAILLYPEQLDLVTHPAPFVVQVLINVEHALSVVVVIGNKSHVNVAQALVAKFHPQVIAVPVKLILLHS